MNHKFKDYVNKLFSYIPVSLSIFTVVFFISISLELDKIKDTYGMEAIDFVFDLYRFFLVRTFLFVLIVPLYDAILESKKFSFKTNLFIHAFVINITVGIMYYQPGSDIISIVYIVAMCTVIYTLIILFNLFREKQFINNANKIFMENEKNESE